MNGNASVTGLASAATSPSDEYWRGRQQLAYYRTALNYQRRFCPEGTTLLDVGGGVGLGCRYLEWFESFAQTSVELPTNGCTLDGVLVIHEDFGTWSIDHRYDLVLCLQLLEHIDDAAAYARKLFECGSTVIISVPYRWPATACSQHIHDPVDESKLKTWTGREPTAWNIVESRLVAIYSETTSDPLATEFAARGDWISRYRIHGCLYGGYFLCEDDPRLAAFLNRCPRPGRLLELGCLEGGHSVELAKAAEHVVALDGRERNLEHARWIQRLLDVSNVSFLHANLETYDLAGLGLFDQIFNAGVLYHLPRPWELVSRLVEIGRDMFLCTHLAPQAEVEQHGYQGIFFTEREGPKSGMSERSFWLVRDDLLRMLADCGFEDIEIIKEFPTRLGPYIWLWCRSEKVR